MIEKLLGKKLLFFDGAMGTQLQAAGLKTGDIPDLWNITHPDTVRDIHLRYLAAGCDIIITNTFGCNGIKMKGSGFTAGEIAARAVENAAKAISALSAPSFSAPKERFIALDIGPTGKLIKPLGDLAFEDAVALFAETVIAGVKAGVDLILIETMSDAYELKAAVLAAKENCNLPVVASVTLDERGKMLTGGGVDVVVALLEGLGVNVIGFNCGLGPGQLTPHVENALRLSSTPLLLMPNAGLPDYLENGGVRYNVEPKDFACVMRQNAENGVWLLGGCCGTTPAHIEALVKTCKHINPPAVTQKNLTVASSYGKTVAFGSKPVIIGERINPTGKPRLRQALKEGDYDFALREAILQTEQGADALDINAGVPGIDEKAVLAELIVLIQGITDMPLQIDTADTNALACALRIYNGKPVINSVTGKTAVMDAIFPLAKRYGGVVVALTIDENGIPETAQGRMDIAKKILNYSEKFGIKKEDFLFDPLTMAVSAAADSASVALECVRRLKQELGVKTSLGVSNISFGLPAREILNAAFLHLALEAGLDAAIFNPGADRTSSSLAAEALLGKDENFERYIAAYSGKKDEAPAEVKDPLSMTLGEAVLRGLKQQAAICANLSLEKQAPLEVIETELIPALNTAGLDFEKGTIYLPQLLMCAEAAKSAFTLIRARLGSAAVNTLGTVVVATVEGDIHDIGKNIVRAMLENFRFQVIDLGRDVPALSVVEAVKKHNARLVGLSALMTTTVAGMEKTIRLLREAAPDCKIMCGGAVLTEEYALRIGADFYGKDAMASVRYSQQVFTG